MTRSLRPIVAPFVVAAPSGTRVRTRLRVSEQDAEVLSALGRHLGALAGKDLAARCAEGRLNQEENSVSRRERRRALTPDCSARWANAIARTSEDQWRLAERNLRAEARSLKKRIREIERRLAVPVGTRDGRVRGYVTQAERYEKQRRLQILNTRLKKTEKRIADGRVSVCRGGRRLAKARHNLEDAGISQREWENRWDASRMFITADGQAAAFLGNQTIRWHPDEDWLELKLPAKLAHLANRPHGRYRLSGPVVFSHRADEVAAQAWTGSVCYRVSFDPDCGRWYLDARWKTPDTPVGSLEELRRQPILAADLNTDHIAACVVLPDGNPVGPLVTIPLDLVGLPASTRDGRLRAAISELISVARKNGCTAIAAEDLDFAEAREQGRERTGNRPSRGKRGKAWRRTVAGIPTGQFRDRLVQMACNQDLAVLAIDPAYSSCWGAEHWLAPLRDKDLMVTGHHAAAVVIGRRAHGHKARRREGVTGPDRRIGSRRATPGAPKTTYADRNGGPRRAQRQPPRRRKTVTARRAPPPDQAAEDRSRVPAEQHIRDAQ